MAKKTAIILILILTCAAIYGSGPQNQFSFTIQQPDYALQTQTETTPGKKMLSESDPNLDHESKSTPESGPQPEPQDKPEVETDIESQLQIKPLKAQFYRNCEIIFTRYVDKQGRVDYKTLSRGQAKRELIAAERLLDNIHLVEYMSWSENEKKAFWINTYNICTIKLIINKYPIERLIYMFTYPDNSIKQIYRPWTKHYFKIMGLEYTLREIEREKLLQRFKDPRICFALSYASISSALLRNEPYYPEKLDWQLDDQVKKFLQSAKGMKIDRTERVIHLSDIFNWYRKTIIEKYGSIKKFRDLDLRTRAYLNFIINYVSPDDAKYIESTNFTIDFLRYDWNLNEQPKKTK